MHRHYIYMCVSVHKIHTYICNFYSIIFLVLVCIHCLKNTEKYKKPNSTLCHLERTSVIASAFSFQSFPHACTLKLIVPSSCPPFLS